MSPQIPEGVRRYAALQLLGLQLVALREHGHDAHVHPETGELGLWLHGRWWRVVGGSSSTPSLLAATGWPDRSTFDKKGSSRT